MDMPAITPLQPAAAVPAAADGDADTATQPFGQLLAAELEDIAAPAETAVALPVEDTAAETAESAAIAGEMLSTLAPAATPPALPMTVTTLPAADSDSSEPGTATSSTVARSKAAAAMAHPASVLPDAAGKAGAANSENPPSLEVASTATAAAVENPVPIPTSPQAAAADVTPVTAAPIAANLPPAWAALPPANPASAAAPVLEVALPVQHRDWAAQFSERVTLTVSEGLQSAELRVNPEELGPVRIRVSLDRNEASLVFAAAHPLVRAAIEDALPALRESLQQAGLQLGETFVAGGQPQGGQEQGSNRSDPARGDKSGESQAVMAENVRHVSASLLVDTYA